MSVSTLDSPSTPQLYQTPATGAVRHGFSLPDFWKMCPFPPGYHVDGDLVTLESEKWFETFAKTQAPPSLFQTVRECRAGQLAGYAYCQPGISTSALRLVSDFLLLLFIIDDLSDLMDDRQAQTFEDTIVNVFNLPVSSSPQAEDTSLVDEPLAAKLVRDWWTRLCLHTTDERWKGRMKSSIIECIESMKKQASIRTTGYLPSLDEFIRHRRHTGGIIPSAAMIEMSLGIEFPDEVISHPMMCVILDCANDFVCFSNDMFSYPNECATFDTHNILILLQKAYGMGLQAAANHVGALCALAVKTYQEAKANLPSYGPELDKDIAAYCQGLENWMIGNLDFSFVSIRYFGDDAAVRDRIRKTLWVSLEKPAANHDLQPVSN